MTIIPTLEAWPTRLIRKPDGQWHPQGYEPTETVKESVSAMVGRAQSEWVRKHDFEPSHLAIGLDCQDEYKSQLARGLGIMCGDTRSCWERFQGLSLIWSNAPGIHLLYDGE